MQRSLPGKVKMPEKNPDDSDNSDDGGEERLNLHESERTLYPEDMTQQMTF